MLIGRVFDYLVLQVSHFGQAIPALIQLIFTIGLIFFIRAFKMKYQTLLTMSLTLIFLSIFTMIFTLNSLANVIGEYAFIFLGIGIIKLIFSD